MEEEEKMNCIICEKEVQGKVLSYLGNVYCNRGCALEGGDYTHEYEKEQEYEKCCVCGERAEEGSDYCSDYHAVCDSDEGRYETDNIDTEWKCVVCGEKLPREGRFCNEECEDGESDYAIRKYV